MVTISFCVECLLIFFMLPVRNNNNVNFDYCDSGSVDRGNKYCDTWFRVSCFVDKIDKNPGKRNISK
jgi:hypothetical protein